MISDFKNPNCENKFLLHEELKEKVIDKFIKKNELLINEVNSMKNEIAILNKINKLNGIVKQ
jgi:hypothetical protein